MASLKTRLPRSSVSEGGRRDRALLATLASSAGLQIATVLGTLVSWPVLTRVLSPAEFGVFTVLTGFHALLGLMDFGVSAALSVRLADAVARADHAKIRTLMAAALIASGGAALLVAATGVVLALVLPWHRMISDDQLAGAQVADAVAALGIALGMAVIGYLGFRVLFALQRGALATRLLLLSTVSGTVALLVAAGLDAPLFGYIMAALGTPALVALLVTVATIRGNREPFLRPDWRAVSARDVLELVAHSGWFWVLSVCTAIAFQADSLIVGVSLGAASAGVFAVVMRLSGLINQTVQPAVLQLLPAFTDALAKGDLAWVRSRLWASCMAAAVVAGAMSLAMVLLAPVVVETWLTPELVPPLSLLVAAAVWQTYTLVSDPVLLLIQAAGQVRVHAHMAIAMVVVNVPLSIVFTLAWGLSGPLWGSLVAHVVCCGTPAVWYVRRLLVGLEEPATPPRATGR